MTVFLDISAALDSHLNDMVGAPSIAWENKNFEPVIGSQFVRPSLLPARTVGATLGASGTDENSGIYQIDIFSPLGEGKNESLTMADSIATHYKPGTELTYNGRLVRVLNVSRRGSVRVDGWMQTVVEIEYLSFTVKR